MRTTFRTACLFTIAAFLGGCVTTNDAGLRLYDKPDMSKLVPSLKDGYVVDTGFVGPPISKLSRLPNPVTRTAITKGKWKGAELWSYEWDMPNDEVNNKMYTVVVVKNGYIVDYAEESAGKWYDNPKMYESAKLASSWENIGGYMAQAARYERAANAGAAYRSKAPSFNPMQFVSSAPTYRPWENAQPANYGMIGGGPIPFGGQQITSTTQSTSAAPQKVYPTWGISGARDITKGQSGVVQDGKVYPTWGISGARDITKGQSGVVQDGKVYATVPGTGMRDISKIAPSGVIEE